MTFNEILDRLRHTRAYTLHSHTQYCDGRATMEEFAKAAVDAGFAVYGFSPHSPVPFESSCNMAKSDVPLYLSEARRLKGKWAGRCEFLTSMEIDYLGDEQNAAQSYFQQLPLDYRISSVHFIKSQDGVYVDIDGRYDSFRQKMSQFFHDDLRYVVETFYAQSQKMVATGGFDIIGHLDKIGHNAGHHQPGIEEEAWYRRLVNDLIDSVEAAGLTVEINTKAWTDHRRMFPGVSHFDRLVSGRIPLVVNSDVHYPALVDASRSIAFQLLDAATARHLRASSQYNP